MNYLGASALLATKLSGFSLELAGFFLSAFQLHHEFYRVLQLLYQLQLLWKRNKLFWSQMLDQILLKNQFFRKYTEGLQALLRLQARWLTSSNQQQSPAARQSFSANSSLFLLGQLMAIDTWTGDWKGHIVWKNPNDIKSLFVWQRSRSANKLLCGRHQRSSWAAYCCDTAVTVFMIWV